MAINLGNVNISLRQFQEISSGKYNAGEVKLTSETAIDKVNNHVTMKFLNTTRISHEEVLAIKNAFVKALKSGGVGTEEINRIRDLEGGYKYFFPGVEGSSNDYDTNRAYLVRLVTGDDNATFATAPEAAKRKVGILMAMLTQYTATMVTDAVSGALELPGSSGGFAFTGVPGDKSPAPEFRLSKDANGDIKIVTTGRKGVQMLATIGENDAPLYVNQVKAGSHMAYEMEITLPKDNLETLANADWTQYDRETVDAYRGDADGRNALIPGPFRFTGTVNISYHMHLNEE